MLSPAVREAYRRDGFVVLPDILTPDEVKALRRVTEGFVEKARQVAANDDIFDLEDSHRPAAPRVRRIKTPHLFHSDYARAARHPKIVALLQDLWGTVRFDTGKLNMKSAGYGAPVEWHQDWAFYPHTKRRLGGGRDHARRSHARKRSDVGAAGQPSGADLRSSCSRRPVLRRLRPACLRPRRVRCGTLSRQGRIDHDPPRSRGARLGDQSFGQGSAVSAVPIPRRRRLTAARLQRRHREIRRAVARRRANLVAAPGRGAGTPAAAAGRISGLDLRKPARRRPPVLRDGFAGCPSGGGIGADRNRSGSALQGRALSSVTTPAQSAPRPASFQQNP